MREGICGGQAGRQVKAVAQLIAEHTDGWGIG